VEQKLSHTGHARIVACFLGDQPMGVEKGAHLRRVMAFDDLCDVVDLDRVAHQPQVFINPEITWKSEELSNYEEGCLSIPEYYEEVERPAKVRLRFTDDALETVAELALQRKVGARGLRMILEDLMLELMYHLPMQRKVRDFVVTAEMVRGHEINWSLLEKAG